MTLYLSSLMSGMLTSRSGLLPDNVGTACALLDTNSFGTAGEAFAKLLGGKGFVAERITDTRGLAGRLPAVKARALDRGRSGADLGVVNARDALMLVLKAGGEGVPPEVLSFTGSAFDLIESSSWWLSARIALVAVTLCASW
jgi:hypothetical protein